MSDTTATAALRIAPLFVGVFAVVQIPLTVAVGLRRVKTGIQLLDGGDAILLRRQRAHGNFVETVPMALMAMAAAEWRGAPAWLLVTGGCSLVIGRTLHYVTLLRSPFAVTRAIGMVLTLLPIAAFGLCAIWRSAW